MAIREDEWMKALIEINGVVQTSGNSQLSLYSVPLYVEKKSNLNEGMNVQHTYIIKHWKRLTWKNKIS